MVDENDKADGDSSPLVVWRDDNAGQLARRLIGPNDGVPDFTAAPLLLDELISANEHDMVSRLRNELANMSEMLDNGPDMDIRQRQRMLLAVRQMLMNCLTPILYDFNSLALQLDQFVAQCAKREETKAGKVELETVRMSVNQHARIGNRVQIDDERWGMIVSPRGDDGMADVMPTPDESHSYGDESMPMSNRVPPGITRGMCAMPGRR